MAKEYDILEVTENLFATRAEGVIVSYWCRPEGILNLKFQWTPGPIATVYMYQWSRMIKLAGNQIFLPLGKKESFGAKGCTGSLAALKGRSCICAALRPHMYYYLWYKFWKSSGFPAKFIIPANDPLFVAKETMTLSSTLWYCWHIVITKYINLKSKLFTISQKGFLCCQRVNELFGGQPCILGLKAAHFIIN